MKIKPLLKEFLKSTFRNEHGEKFTIYSDGTSVYMSGNEVDMMVDPKNKSEDGVIPLFNPSFNVWSDEELYKLGKALQKVSWYKK